MKPPYLKKLTKKQLRKAYSDQWKQNIKVVTENYNLNRDNERLQTIVYNQEQEINTKAILLTEHFWKIQDLNFLLDHERKERVRVELQAVDLEEALSRSRQLRKSLQEVADRKHGEKAKIEDMAKNLHTFVKEELAKALVSYFPENETATRANTQLFMQVWDDLCDGCKDHFRAHATHIISHLPTDEKWKTTNEGSPE